MPKQIAQNELDIIIDIVAKFPEGVPLGKIMESLSVSISRRNVQHRLVFLVKKGLLHAEGKARARLYKLPPKEEKDVQGRFEAYNAHAISLSREGEEIQALVIQPIQARTPVGYNIQFLDEYRPNVTCYLSESIRQRLFEIGKTDGEQPAGTYARKIFGRLLIDLSWNSSRLEGNTYSQLKTR